jgi:hypothetical protein
VLLLVVFSQNIILAIVAEAYEEAKALLGSANTSFIQLIFLRVLFLFVLLAAKFSKVVRGIRRAIDACCCGAAATGVTGVTGASVARSAGDGYMRNPSAQSLGDDLEAAASVMPERFDKSVSGRSLRRAMTHLAAIRLETGDERMYREMMGMAQRTLQGSWGSWARRYWAPWAVVRTPGVRSLAALYQDFASYKIKTQPPWIGVSFVGFVCAGF